MAKRGSIRAGMGGWTFEPWRGTFYPDKLAHAKELSYAAEHVPTIEVNGTFYRTQTPATFAKWASEICLNDQESIIHQGKTIEQLRTDLVAKIGENITVRRFVRWELGEGIEKKKEDFSAEVAKMAAGEA